VIDEDQTGTCEHCGKVFDYKLIHNGFNDSTHAYCDRCGTTALINLYEMDKRVETQFNRIAPLPEDVARLLQSCSCGGRFCASAAPRCPACNRELSAELAAAWLERNAPGTKHGWRWQRTWPGLYALIIAGRVINDPFLRHSKT